MQQFLETGERKPGQGLVPVEATRNRLGAVIVGAYLLALVLQCVLMAAIAVNGGDVRAVADAFGPAMLPLNSLASVVVGFYFARSVK